jgi:hypothetical protein
MDMKKHLSERHMNILIHKCWIDNAEGVATFPLYDPVTYAMGGYQQYRPSRTKSRNNDPRLGKYYSFYSKNHKLAVWGLESWKFSNTLFLTEGIFDAARITEVGHSAIAVIGNNPKPLTEWLWMIRQSRRVVAVCDPDAAGQKLAKFGTVFHTMKCGTDLGDAPQSYVEDLVHRYK